MNRKTIIAGLIVVVLSIVIVFAVKNLSNFGSKKQNALEAVPLDAAIVLTSPSLDHLLPHVLNNNDVYQQLKKLPDLSRFHNVIQTIDSLAEPDLDIQKLYKRSNFSMSVHKQGRDKLNFIYYINVPNGFSRNKIEELFQKYISGETKASSRKYEGFAIIDIEIKQEKPGQEISLSVVKDLLIVSSSSILLENALRQLKQDKKIYHSEGFRNVQKTLGKNVNANVYVNYIVLPDVLNAYFQNENNPVSAALNDFSSWAGLDLHINPEAFMLSGFSHLKDSLNSFLNLFANQTPQQIQLFEILPSSSNTFLVFGVENFSEFSLKYNDHLNFLGKYSRRKASIEKFQNKYNFSFYDDFTKYFGNEFGFAISEFSSVEGSSDLPFVIIETKSGERLTQSLKKLVSSEDNAPQNTKRIRIDENTIINVYKLPFGNFSNYLLGHFFNFPNIKYAAVIDNHLVLGESPEGLAKFAHLRILGKTLASNPVFMNFSQLMSDVTNIFFYTNIPKSVNIYNDVLNEKLVSGIRKNNEVFQKVQALGVQYNVANKRMFTNIFLQYNQQFNEAAHTVWETLLDTAMNFKPVFVENHYTKDNEIFVQDLNGNVYLINSVGRVLWKFGLKEQINSEIYQVDYYKNGKLQYLFSTSSELHLLDRNGNYVERYPITLRSKASAGMALFDYANNGNYRIFIPAQNKEVYLYDIEGNLIEGWNFKGAEHVVKHPVKHFRIGTRDYIVFSDGLRFYILNRRGEVRVPVNELIKKSKNNQLYLDKTGNPQIITTSEDGSVIKVDFNGIIQKQKIGEFGENHYFDFEDVDADGEKDFIFLDNKELRAYNQQGKQILSYKFSVDATHPPLYYHFSYRDRKIGITLGNENRIYLINNDGTLYEGFPLQGNTAFSIGKLTTTSRFNLIVGNNDNFLLNYSVQ